jgi:hypothetical protein
MDPSGTGIDQPLVRRKRWTRAVEERPSSSSSAVAEREKEREREREKEKGHQKQSSYPSVSHHPSSSSASSGVCGVFEIFLLFFTYVRT